MNVMTKKRKSRALDESHEAAGGSRCLGLSDAPQDDLMSYAGLARSSYGQTAHTIDAAIDALREEWSREVAAP